ncbi:hypothetical protein HY640_03355 [Candidatus Woesearchaeota archaeon]|nr:hypothetical protein [Candidatus Woesearchaeota archaeon]
MKDILVTIKIPESLLEELRKTAETDHYMDLSEAIRSIVRRNWAISSEPYLHEVRKLREDITASVQEKSRKIAEQMLIEELKKIRKELK